MKTKDILNYVYDDLDFVSKETWITMICKYLTTNDLEEMLDMNELTPRFRFIEDEDEA
tara:strand:- start:152 stop:325 length:174 start_codon:yes stop_codon:yes gene_type:complete